jgi:hypothetical protein
MDKRTQEIYYLLYQGSKSKEYLSDYFKVTTKTIENTIAKVSDDIMYDKKLGAYRFSLLLPSYIPSKIFLAWVSQSVQHTVIKHDFATFIKFQEQEEHSKLLPTYTLTSLFKKIIQLQLAIIYNISLKIFYKGHEGKQKIKYINPHKLNTSLNSYYLYASYTFDNKKDVGEFRSFSLGAMVSLEIMDYKKEGHFAIEGLGNAYGMIDKVQYITLKLTEKSASYFKREGEFSHSQYDYICEEADGSVLLKMYYNHTQEIVQLLQRWMPYIKIYDEGDVKEEVYREIEKSYLLWINKDELC